MGPFGHQARCRRVMGTRLSYHTVCVAAYACVRIHPLRVGIIGTIGISYGPCGWAVQHAARAATYHRSCLARCRFHSVSGLGEGSCHLCQEKGARAVPHRRMAGGGRRNYDKNGCDSRGQSSGGGACRPGNKVNETPYLTSRAGNMAWAMRRRGGCAATRTEPARYASRRLPASAPEREGRAARRPPRLQE